MTHLNFNVISNFQKICAGASDTVGSSLPNISAYYLFVSTFFIIILMVAIKTVCRQIAMQEGPGSPGNGSLIGIPEPKNRDSLFLNLLLVLLVTSSMVLYMVYWKG